MRPAESVFNESIVADGSFANASSTGANTVNWPPLSVSTRLTFGFNFPETAALSVVSSELFDAATATGSCAIAAIEPGPVAPAAHNWRSQYRPDSVSGRRWRCPRTAADQRRRRP